MALTDTFYTFANDALIKLGSPTVSDFTTEAANNVKEAVVMLALESRATEEFLLANQAGWQFARKYAELTNAVEGRTPPDFKWSYSYDLPTDFLKLIEVYNVPENEYDLVYPVIHIDVDPVEMVYIHSGTGYTPFLGPIGNAFSTYLAFRSCMSLTKQAKLYKVLEGQWLRDLSLAIAFDARNIWDEARANEPDVIGDR
jgi:hypothetical protein